MLRFIILATIFSAMYSTKCYEQPIWNNLVVLKKTDPHDPDVLQPFKQMTPPYSRYEIQPGSHGMFSDIAQGIQTRMKGIAKGPYIIVFDYGGIAPKYFSIIEDMASGSGVKVGPLGTVMVEPPSIVDHVISPNERIAPVQNVGVGRLGGTRSYLKPTARTAVPYTEETILEIPASGSKDDLLINDGITWKLNKTEVPSTTKLLTSSTTVQSVVNTNVHNMNGDYSYPSNGIVSMKELIMKKPTSSSESTIPPSSTTLALESFTGGENIPSKTDTIVSINGKQSPANEPSAIDPSVKAGDGTSSEAPSESGIGESLLKVIVDKTTSSDSSVMKVLAGNPASSLKGDSSPISALSAHESVNSEENIPSNMGTVETNEGEHSLIDDSSTDEGEDKLKSIDAERLTTTLPISSKVLSSETIMGTPVSIWEENSLKNDWETSTAQMIEAALSTNLLPNTVTTTTEPLMEMLVSLFNEDLSENYEATSALNRIDAKPSAISASIVESPVENIAQAPISIISGNNSPGDSGITSMMNPSSAMKENIPSGTTAMTLQPYSAEGNITLHTGTAVNIEGEKSLYNNLSDVGSPVNSIDRPSGKDSFHIEHSKLQNIEATPSAITQLTSTEVLSTAETTVEIPVSILKDEPTTNDRGTATLETTGPTASEIIVEMRVSIPKDEMSGIDGLTSTIESIVAKPSTTKIPTDSTKEIIVETPLSILEDESPIKDVITNTSKWIVAEPSTTTPPTVNTETPVTTPFSILHDNLGGGIASTAKLIKTTPSTDLNSNSSPSTSVVSLESTIADGSILLTMKTVLPNYSERSVSNEPHTIESSVDMSSGQNPSDIGRSKQKRIEAKPSEITLPTLSTDSSIVDTNRNTNVLIPKDGSSVNDRELQMEIITTVPTASTVASGQDTSGVGKSEQKSSDSSALQSNLNTYILIPKYGSTIDDGVSLMSIEEKPSIARTKETILVTPLSISENKLPTKTVVASSLKWRAGNSSKPSPQTARKESVNNPVNTLNNDDSSSGGGIHSTKKLSMLNPASTLNLNDPSSSTASTLDSINAAENIPSTINIVSPIEEGEQSLRETAAIDSSVKAVDGASQGTSALGLGSSLLKGISDGVTTSIATAGSGIASMMKLIMSPVSGVTDLTSPITTSPTLESVTTEENIPLTSNTVEGGRALLSFTSMKPHMKTVDLASGKDPSGMRLSKFLLDDIAKGMKNGLDGVKATEFSGKTSIALLDPDQRVSIAGKSKNEITYFNALKNSALNAGDAEALYKSIKPVTTEVSFIIKSQGFNCVPLRLTKLNLNLYLVDSIVFGDGHICGLENIQPGNMVTIIEADEEAMQVTMPLVLKHLTVRIDSVDVSNYFFTLIKGQPIEASVKEISSKGTFTFRKGTPFQLTSFRMEWGDITGVHIKLEGAMKEGSHVSGIIDNIADALSGVIKMFISPIFDEIEKQITKSILGS